MGVEVTAIDQPLTELPGLVLAKIEEDIVPPQGSVRGKGDGEKGFILEHRYNDSFKAVNRLLKKGAEVYWTREKFKDGRRWSVTG